MSTLPITFTMLGRTYTSLFILYTCAHTHTRTHTNLVFSMSMRGEGARSAGPKWRPDTAPHRLPALPGCAWRGNTLPAPTTRPTGRPALPPAPPTSASAQAQSQAKTCARAPSPRRICIPTGWKPRLQRLLASSASKNRAPRHPSTLRKALVREKQSQLTRAGRGQRAGGLCSTPSGGALEPRRCPPARKMGPWLGGGIWANPRWA